MPPAEQAAPALRTLTSRILRVAFGNMLEMYDFMVFGFYARQIGAVFFPNRDPVASLLAAFATFGAGFLMRPLGAVVLGAWIDRHGRRRGLILTLSLMALGTLTVALAPGYATIGLAAPVLVLAGRLLQGFSAGAELGAVSVYLTEIAPPRWRGAVGSAQSGSQQVAVIAAALIGFTLTSQLGTAERDAWGWRIPFLIGCAIVPLLLLLRRGLEETQSFGGTRHHPAFAETVSTLRRAWKVVARGMLLVAMTTVSFYTITAYTPTFGHDVLHLSLRASLAVTLLVGVSNLLLLPLGGALSDRIGRRPVLIGCTLAACAIAYPSMHRLTAHPGFGALLAVELALSVVYALYNGALIPFLSELMPRRVRVSAFSLAYSLATALFGGFTPYACTWLIQRSGNPAMPGLWLDGAALLALAAALPGVQPWRDEVVDPAGARPPALDPGA